MRGCRVVMLGPLPIVVGSDTKIALVIMVMARPQCPLGAYCQRCLVVSQINFVCIGSGTASLLTLI
jgi:hypothetical protein